MVITATCCELDLSEFGILIPIKESRHRKTLEYLLAKFGPGDWLEEVASSPLTPQDLAQVHSQEYVDKLFGPHCREEIIATYELRDPDSGEYNRYDPSMAKKNLECLFSQLLCQAKITLYTCRRALTQGFRFFLGGGMHHALYDRGAGFCPFSDILVAVRTLQGTGELKKVWIIDIDAHKGDGTAALTQGDENILTLSIHTAEGWPMDQPQTLEDGTPNPSFLPSTVDISVGAQENETYLPRLTQGLEKLESIFIPDLAIVVAGADPYEGDALPSASGLQLSLEAMLERDRLVYDFLTSRNIPRAYLMAGGYGEEVWRVYAQFLEERIGEFYDKR